jgi:apolipoprotein N-acyltransferase
MDTPLCRLAMELAALTGWRRYGLGFLLGVLLAGAFPPVDLTPLILVSFPGLFWLDEGSRGPWASARLGYVFGLGFFTAGLYWIAAALLVDLAAFWWVLPIAVLGVPAGFALFTAAALLVTRLATTRLALSPLARVFIFAIAWNVADWLRGHILTGFPWNLAGYVWSGGFPGSLAVLQSTAVVGIYGLGFLTVLAAALPALYGVSSLARLSVLRRAGPGLLAVALILVPGGLGALRLHLFPSATTGMWLRLVQPSIPQSLKWDPAAAEDNFHRLTELSNAAAPHPLGAVLWPEAATPFLLDRDPVHRRAVAVLAPKAGYLIAGALRANPPPAPVTQVWNSVEAVDAAGETRAHYDKAHLVPFGEYMPLAEWLPLGPITPGSVGLSAGPGPRTLSLSGLPPFSPLVCYEVIFPGAATDPDSRPAWLLNVTNDAWYGRSSGPYQHFAIARTRAVEEGLPLVRVANNGISGVVDAMGRVVARTHLNDVTYTDIELPAPGPATPYQRIGDWGFLALLGIGLFPAALRLR